MQAMHTSTADRLHYKPVFGRFTTSVESQQYVYIHLHVIYPKAQQGPLHLLKISSRCTSICM